MSPTPTVLCIVGWKGAGKTTLAEGLIRTFREMGLTVAAIKHTHHDVLRDEGDATDTARLRRAGAAVVLLAGAERVLSGGNLVADRTLTLDELIALVDQHDLIVVEGFKRASIPKIEVRASAVPGTDEGRPFDHHVIAIVSPSADASATPRRFKRDDLRAIADFAIETLGITAR